MRSIPISTYDPESRIATASGASLTGMAARGVAILSGISIVTGRIYYLNCRETLGVPTWESPPGFIEYIVLSPD